MWVLDTDRTRVPAYRTRVLAIHPFPDLYGSDLMLVRSLKAMRTAGMQVAVLVPEEGPLFARLREERLFHRVVPFTVLRKSLLSVAGMARLLIGLPYEIWRLSRLLRRVRPGLLYVNTITLPTWLIAARLRGIPCVCHVRELEETATPALTRLLTAPLLTATHLIVNSRATLRFLAAQWRRLGEHATVVYNGLEFPDETEFDDSRHREGGRRRVTVVGRLSPRKGQDLAVEAIARLVSEGADVELELVGSVFRGYEWFEQTLRRMAADHGIADRLLMPGFRSPVWQCYADADIVVVPSRLEPFGNVAAEALAMARPVIASRVGGLTEIIDDGRTGTVVEPDDTNALVTSLQRLLNEPETADDMARRGRADVRDRFALERYERELVATLRRFEARPDDPSA